MAERNGTRPQRVTIKKYANRRLYNTATSAYVTLDHLSDMIKSATDFVVYDARTGEDITRSVLTQLVVEEDAKGHGLLSVDFLRQVISFSGDPLEALVPRYLEKAMVALERNKTYLRKHIRESLDGLFPFGPFDSAGELDVAFFESLGKGTPPKLPLEAEPAATGELDQLREQLSRMQNQLDRLSGRASKT